MSTGIAVFTRAPVAGATKTRLVPLLGAEGAVQAHRQLLALALRHASEACPGQVSIHVAGDIHHPELHALSAQHQAPLVEQQGADLGERMCDAIAWVLERHVRALVIGSDCAVLDAPALQQAADALQSHDMVFTPAEDGGYVLVGARRGAQVAPAFAGIHWGTGGVMSTSRQRARDAGLTHTELPTLWDVDEPADWRRAVAGGWVAAVAGDASSAAHPGPMNRSP